MARCKDNARDGKGTSWEGQREVNWAECIDNTWESDNHHAQEEFGNDGEDDYQDNWGSD